MSKKFDVVIGNPPYQDDLIGDNESKAPPIYHHFMDAAFQVSIVATCGSVSASHRIMSAFRSSRFWQPR